MNTNLWEVANWIEDARTAVAEAILLANRICDECDGEWPAVNTLLDNLTAVKVAIDAATPAEFTEAVKTEKEVNDDMEDRADAASY